MIRIRKHVHRIESMGTDGCVLKTGTAGRDDSDIIQDAVRRRPEGGEILLCAGTYHLTTAIEVDLPVTIRGEGRGSEVRPPAGDFAFKISYTGRCPDRTVVSFKIPPPHAAPGADWETLPGERDDRPGARLRLHGVQLADLAIQGDGQGKGIYLECLTESVLRDLWIMNTTDGAALYLGVEVMECVFENLHLSNCGSPSAGEATIAIPCRNGNGCNNVHFRSVFVIFPRYIGIEIGAGDEPGVPRLIWFEHCMLHGWQRLTSPAPYDLVRVNRTDAERGIFFANCRLGMGQNDADPENRHIRVRQGQVDLDHSVVGGGQSRQMLEAECGSTLVVRNNHFHGLVSASVLRADRAGVLFGGNTVEVSGGENLLELHAPTRARITDNDFRLAGEQCPLRLAAPAGPVLVTGNVITGGDWAPRYDLPARAAVVERDNAGCQEVQRD